MINRKKLNKITVPSILLSKSKGQQGGDTKTKTEVGDTKAHQNSTPQTTIEKITALTAYDYTTACLFDRAGVDIILVGDSVATVMQGHSTTLPVTLDEMIYHCKCVTAGVKRALVVGDMPFLSYQSSIEKGVESAGRLLKEGGASAVKLEGGVYMAATIEKLVQVDIPVVGHIGLTPQSFHRMGGHKQQGRTSSSHNAEVATAGSKERIIEDAIAVEEAGAFALVIEGVPAELGAEITSRVSIPTIGIGAGYGCDGQILVYSDMLGLNPDFCPSFVKQYVNLAEIITAAVKQYISEVESGVFPQKP